MIFGIFRHVFFLKMKYFSKKEKERNWENIVNREHPSSLPRKRWQPATGIALKLATFDVSPDDGAGDINIIPYDHFFQNSPNRMIKISYSSFSLAVKKMKQKKAAFAANAAGFPEIFDKVAGTVSSFPFTAEPLLLFAIHPQE